MLRDRFSIHPILRKIQPEFRRMFYQYCMVWRGNGSYIASYGLREKKKAPHFATEIYGVRKESHTSRCRKVCGHSEYKRLAFRRWSTFATSQTTSAEIGRWLTDARPKHGRRSTTLNGMSRVSLSLRHISGTQSRPKGTAQVCILDLSQFSLDFRA